MLDRRVDRIETCLCAMGGRARFQQLRGAVRAEESNPDLSYQAVYIAIQMENQRLTELGERTKFVTSREGEQWGWVRLVETHDNAESAAESELEAIIRKKNDEIGDQIRAWLQQMDWRTFESTFLLRVLEALGFQDIKITPPTRDGGADALVSYRRGIIEARALVSVKHWTARAVPVDEVQKMRGYWGTEDTAVIITTGRFTADAENEAKKPWQNNRHVYLIDGETLIDICKRHRVGVKSRSLPELLVLDPELTREPPADDVSEDDAGKVLLVEETSGGRRLRDEMLGVPERGRSAEEVAELSGLALSTVRSYLSNPGRRKALGQRIRTDPQVRARALKIVSRRREGTGF